MTTVEGPGSERFSSKNNLEDSFEKIILIDSSDEHYLFSLKYEWQLQKVEKTELQEIFNMKQNLVANFNQFQTQPKRCRHLQIKIFC